MSEYSPEHLKFYMEKRIQTTMIGAIARVEKHFGFLWGHNKEGDLTDEEEQYADMWDFTRNEILNHGNNQIRNIKEDFYQYGGIFKTRYQYNFQVPDKDKINNKQLRKDN